MITFPLATHTSRRVTPPWPGSSGVTFIQMEADKHGQYTNTPKASRPTLCLAQRAPASPLQRLHPVSGIWVFSLPSLAQREDLQMPETHILFHIRKKKSTFQFYRSWQLWAELGLCPQLSKEIHSCSQPSLTDPALSPKKSSRKIMRRDGMAHSELRRWPFWEALLQDSPGPVHRCFSPLFAQKLLHEKPPPSVLYALRGQRFNMIILPYYWYFIHVTILFH